MTIALCFLTLGDVTQPRMWEAFLARAPEARIYCHPKIPAEASRGFLRDGIIRDRVETQHGGISLVDASLNLFRAAFEDSRNTHVILLSETAIPIVPFAEIEGELGRSEGLSYISFNVPAPGTEHFLRQRALPKGCHFSPFFQHDQWLILSRRHVELLRDKPKIACFSRLFAPDEHYFLIVLAHVRGVPPAQVRNSRKTFVNWRDRAVKETRDLSGRIVSRTIHPKTYDTLSPGIVEQARGLGCWFLRKVSPACDCSGVVHFVS